MSNQQEKPAEIHANTIEALRWAIDQADAELVALLNQRAEYAQRIGVLKGNSVAFVPARERAVLDHADAANQGPLPMRRSAASSSRSSPPAATWNNR